MNARFALMCAVLAAGLLFHQPVLLAQSPPTVSPILNQTANEDTPIGPVAFTIGDATKPAAQLVVTAASANQFLVPSENITLGGAVSNRTVTIRPATNASGTTTITLTIDNGTRATNRSFTVTFNPVNDPPTLDPVFDRAMLTTAGDQYVYLTGIGSGAADESQGLSMTVIGNSNPAIFASPPEVLYTSSSSYGYLRLYSSLVSGSSVLVVQINDGGASNNLITRSFTVTATNVATDLNVGTYALNAYAGVLQPFTFQEYVQNYGPFPATNVVLTARFSSNAPILSVQTSSGSCMVSGGVVTCSFPVLPVGSSRSINVTVLPQSLGVITGYFAVTSGLAEIRPENNQRVLENPVIYVPDLVIDVKASTDQPQVNSSVTYDIGITNLGQVVSTNASFYSGFSGLEVLAVNSFGANCSMSVDGANCDLGNLAAGAGVRLQVTARPVRAGYTEAYFYATAVTPEANYGNNGTNLLASAFVEMASIRSITPITIPTQGVASPYPSTIFVSGLTSRVVHATVTLHGLTHPAMADLDVLLVSPSGRAVTLLSDMGGPNAAGDLTLTFDDYANVGIETGQPPVSGRYVPSDSDESFPQEPGEDFFPPPAPGGVPAGGLNFLNGSNPNGTWSLYVVADTNGGSGIIAGGWTLVVETDERSVVDYATFHSVASYGDAGNVGTGSNFFSEVNLPSINQAGQVAFSANVYNEDFSNLGFGFWVQRDEASRRRLAFTGEPAPGPGTGFVFAFMDSPPSAPAISSAGAVAFAAHVEDTNSGFSATGIWAGDAAKTLAMFALSEQPVPGAETNLIFAGEFNTPSINATGLVAFYASIADNESGNSGFGLCYGSQPSNLTVLARNGGPASGNGMMFVDIQIPEGGSPAISDSGQMAFAATVSDALGNPAFGVWVGRNAAELQAVGLSDQSAPGVPGGGVFANDLPPTLAGLTAAGRAVFAASVFNGSGESFNGVWAGANAEDQEMLLLRGLHFTLNGQPSTLAEFTLPRVGPGGDILFIARWGNAEHPDEDLYGLLRRSAEGVFTLVASNGQHVAGLPVGALVSVDTSISLRAVINRVGQAALALPVNSVDFSEAVFSYDPRAGLVAVLSSGDIVETSPGVFHSVEGFGFPEESGLPRGQDGRSPFNDAGELALPVSFSENGGGSTSLVIARLGCASVGDAVFYDRNGNGRRDTEEPGVAEVRVELYDAGPDGQPGGGDDTLAGLRSTDDDGRYQIGATRGGNYFLKFLPPPGFGFTARDAGGDDTLDSDADPANNQTAVFALTPGQRDFTRDAGLISGFAARGDSVVEGDAGLRQLAFMVQLGVPRRSPVSVAFSTASGTATEGVDFQHTNGVLNFSPGERTKVVLVTVIGDTNPENDETVRLVLSNPVGVPVVGSPGFGVILNDDPLPPAPSHPCPSHRSVMQPLSTDLAWSGTIMRDLIVNGDFESGDFSGWQREPLLAGYEIVTDIAPDYPGPSGQFFAHASTDLSFGTKTISQQFTIPADATSAFLRWIYFISSNDDFSPTHYVRVELRDVNDLPLAVLFNTSPGDNPYTDWQLRTRSLLNYRGQTVRLAFITRADDFYLETGFDEISLKVIALENTTFDVYFGTNPQPGPAQFLGNTTNRFWSLPPLQPLTTYFWQIVARRGEASVPGPVWQFTTRRNTTNSLPRLADNPTSLFIPDFTDDGSAQPYPSTITVSDLYGQIAQVTVTLYGLTHFYPEDLDVLLVGPRGRRVLLMSDAGSSNAVDGLTLTFTDAAATALPTLGPLVSGSFRPANYDGYLDVFPPPAPSGPYADALSAFNESDPNGVWSLYVNDNFSFEDGGYLAGGWSLAITTFFGDTDGDGLPDDYEQANNYFDPFNPADALADADGDGDSNLHEYQAGTDPFDGGSVLRITDFFQDGNDLVFRVSIGAGHNYLFERMDDLNEPGVTVAILPGTGDNYNYEVRDVGGVHRTRQFYRMRVAP